MAAIRRRWFLGERPGSLHGLWRRMVSWRLPGRDLCPIIEMEVLRKLRLGIRMWTGFPPWRLAKVWPASEIMHLCYAALWRKLLFRKVWQVWEIGLSGLCSALITVSFEHESQLKIIQGSYEKIYVGHSPNGYNRYYRSGGFRGLANLTTFDASNCSQIESIEPSAFYHCSKLQSVKVGTMIPPTCGIDAFSELNSYTILTVPKESIEAYKQANEWKNFTNITALN